MLIQTRNTTIRPTGRLGVLSQTEIERLTDSRHSKLHDLFRTCCLAVMNCDNETDDPRLLLQQYHSFSVAIISEERGIKLYLENAPASAFVGRRMIRGISEHIFAVLRDIVFSHDDVFSNESLDQSKSYGITDSVFHLLRNAGITEPVTHLRLVVCWGGHSISRTEYDYTKKVGYELGLRRLDVCTGCGPGAMKGPMKGATIGHAKQRIQNGRYLGITEPGIIAAESPNPIVNNLVILPDIEKRLEAFVRLGHGIIVFPGGVGTAEEILYLLGILLHPENKEMPFPLVFTGPASSKEYFESIDRFLRVALGDDIHKYYRIVVGDSAQAADYILHSLRDVRRYRRETRDAYYFNWRLKISEDYQEPFNPTHENMSSLRIDRDMPAHELAANLRRVFSGIVAGNVKEEGIKAVEQHGHFEIHGDTEIMESVDFLLQSFVADNRMKLEGVEYSPCYRIVK